MNACILFHSFLNPRYSRKLPHNWQLSHQSIHHDIQDLFLKLEQFHHLQHSTICVKDASDQTQCPKVKKFITFKAILDHNEYYVYLKYTKYTPGIYTTILLQSLYHKMYKQKLNIIQKTFLVRVVLIPVYLPVPRVYIWNCILQDRAYEASHTDLH